MSGKYVLILTIALVSIVNSKVVRDTTITGKDTTVVCTLYSDKGNSVYRYLNGKKHGRQESFFSSGELEFIRKFDNGCQIDTPLVYFRNGNLRSFAIYKNCMENGISISFSQDGDTTFIGTYKDGKRVGTARSWYQNGHLKEIIHYNKDGEKDGVRQRWYENGNCRDSMVYDNGLPYQGIEYYENGKKRAWYKKGYIDWDAKGIRHRHVETITYTPEGKKLSHIKKGNGLYKYYLDDGRCIQNQVVDGKEGPMPQPCK